MYLLGRKGSNLRSRIQRPLPYHLATPHRVTEYQLAESATQRPNQRYTNSREPSRSLDSVLFFVCSFSRIWMATCGESATPSDVNRVAGQASR